MDKEAALKQIAEAVYRNTSSRDGLHWEDGAKAEIEDVLTKLLYDVTGTQEVRYEAKLAHLKRLLVSRVEERLVLLLGDMANPLLGIEPAKRGEWMTHEEMATRIYSTRESVSRAMTKLAKDGFVENQRRWGSGNKPELTKKGLDLYHQLRSSK